MQSVEVVAPVLRDVLVDVDLRRHRVIAIEPGPESQTTVWKPGKAATPSGAEDED